MKNQDLTYLNSLAISCLATGLVDTAQPAFELISDAVPEHAAGPIGLASVELARGNYNEACKILENASAELKGDSDRTRRILLHALVASNKRTNFSALVIHVSCRASTELKRSQTHTVTLSEDSNEIAGIIRFD